MNEAVSFLSEHWILSLAFIVILLALIINEILQEHLGIKKVSVEEATQIINHEDGLMLDIRSDKAFNEGHILGSHHLANGQIEAKLNTLQKWKSKVIIIVGAMEQEAQKAGRALLANGFRVKILKEGFHGWKTAGLPVVKK